MFPDPDEGVVIGDGRCGVRLKSAGDPEEWGWPTIVDVRAGPFVGSVLESVENYPSFRAQLAKLYEQFAGTAHLGGDHGFTLDVEAGELGAIAVSVHVEAEHWRPIVLNFQFGIDQSYLPSIIKRLGVTFAKAQP